MVLLPVILSGGIGSRLWPLSRKTRPKPFIKLGDSETILQKTYIRAIDVSSVGEVVCVTHRDLFYLTQDNFQEIDASIKNTFILEPIGRNSTSAIAVAAQYALRQHGGDSIILVMPADHLVTNMHAFTQALNQAKQLASHGKLVTFGIKPRSPETGYGYILADGNKVRKFIEKPDIKTAEQYIANENYNWNSGIFCMRTDSFLKELELFQANIAEQTHKALINAGQSTGSNWKKFELQNDDFKKIQSISVDYAIFEKSKKIAIVPCDIGWSDIGSWPQLGALYQNDNHNNNIVGNVVSKETENCVIYGEDRLITTLDVNNLIIADTPDALLIANKDRAQDVNTIVDTLKSKKHLEYEHCTTTHRPWGSYTVLQEAHKFKIKRIEVKPGGCLSLQSHKHRCEHWIIVQGKAKVTNNEEVVELKPSESIYIPLGNKHRLENIGTELLIVIEVQCGEHLSESDIVRYEDIYGR